MEKDIKLSFQNAIEQIFSNKSHISKSVLENLESVNYNNLTKTLDLRISKEFVVSLLQKKVNEIKFLTENNFRNPIQEVVINGKKQESVYVKNLGLGQGLFNQKTIETRIKIKEQAVNKKTIEKTIEEMILETKPFYEKESYKHQILRLDFYNLGLGTVEEITIKKSYISYKSEFLIAIIFIWTGIVPIVFFTLGLINLVKFKASRNKVKYFLSNGYTPLNKPAKKFVKKFIK